MNPEDRELIRRAVVLGEENNTILRKMQRSSRMNAAFRVLYWLVVTGISIVAFYFLQPYVAFLRSTFTTISQSTTATTTVTQVNMPR